MKKGLIFFLGMIAGAVLTVLVLVLIGMAKDSEGDNSRYGNPGIYMFSEAGQTMPLKSFRVFQVLPNGTALAESSEKDKVKYSIEYGDPVVLLLAAENAAYYDDQVIKVPADKVVRQVGTYRYETQNDFVKTVPIISFLDK